MYFSMQKVMNPLSTNPIDKFKRRVWLDKASQRIKDSSVAKLKYGSEKKIILFVSCKNHVVKLTSNEH